MSVYLAKTALLPDGWAHDVLITVDCHGFIQQVQGNQKHSNAIILDNVVVPSVPNIHSHAFQRAMAGLTEYKEKDQDNFWTWRKSMYDFLESLGPDELEEIAMKLYKEMKLAGYGSVGEFHYLHHQSNGQPYDDTCETSHRMIRAAKAAEMSITHMPVLYACSGFGGKAPEDGQKRFINSPDGILDIVSSLYREYKDDPMVRIGFAFHSLRAVTKDMMDEVLQGLENIDPTMPIHIHIAEQETEVKECVEWSGVRPVRWLLDNYDLSSHWCLIHATHMDENETRDLAHTGAVAGLCPSTEANLGDGVFNLKDYIGYGGRFAVGSDSHISVDVFEELRLLEYGQRLIHRQRNIACSFEQPHVGRYLFGQALKSGAQALGQKIGKIEKGYLASFILLKPQELSMNEAKNDQILDKAIFSPSKIECAA